MFGTTRVSRYQKGKTGRLKPIWIYWSKRQWVAVASAGLYACKSAPHPRQPRQHPTTQFFTGWMPFLPPNQQHQSISFRKVIMPKNMSNQLCFCRSGCPWYSWKTADWIWMSFGVVDWLDPRMRQVVGVGNCPIARANFGGGCGTSHEVIELLRFGWWVGSVQALVY